MEMSGIQYVEFFIDSVEQRTAEGQPFYVDREFIRVTNPGGKDCVEREVQEKDKVVWMAQYRAFKEGVQYEGEGFKLRDVSFLSKAETEICRKARIFTVEQLAKVDENGAKSLGLNAFVLIKKAKDWLEARNGTDALVNKINALEQKISSYDELTAEIKAQKDLNDTKDKKIAELMLELEKVQKKDKK